ncbi:MAG: hypothetical protein DHS20C11_16480 [Lysobacteraceae bacterium]|nr:MAG: hypothetical protein DHS20C11_16480 [Xanthomonadaceae bacterium]
MHTWVFIILAGLSFTSAATSMQQSARPDWVTEPGFNADAKRMSGESGLRYLLIDRQQRFAIDGEFAHYFRYAAKTVSRRGIDAVAQLQVDFDPTYQQLTWHDIQVHRDGETTTRLDLESIELLHRELTMEYNLVDGRRTAHAVLDDIQVGDIVEWSYTITGRNPIFGETIFGVMQLGWDYPVNQVYQRLLVPKGREPEFEYLAGAEKTKRNRIGDYREYIWNRQRVERVQTYTERPRWHHPFPVVSFSEFDSWADVVQWALPIYSPAPVQNMQLLERMKSLAAADGTAEQRILAALEMAQDEIRYFGIELGENSHRPSPPDETYARRYGDCKDKAMLLQALLAAQGIESAPALVSTTHGRGFEAFAPSPLAFNHVILKVTLEGQTYWVDPTRSSQRGDLLDRFPDYQMALPVAQGSKKPEPMPIPSAWAQRQSTIESFSTTEDLESADLVVEYTFTTTLADSVRDNLVSEGNELVMEHLQGVYGRVYGEVYPIGDLATSDHLRSNQLILTGEFEFPGFWENVNNYRRVETHASTIAEFLPLPSRFTDTSPLAVQFPIVVEHTITVADPVGFEAGVFETGENELNIEDDALHYYRSISLTDEELTIFHRLTTRQDAVTRENVQSHLGTRRDILESLGVVVVGLSNERTRLKQREQRLKNNLRKLIGDKQ